MSTSHSETNTGAKILCGAFGPQAHYARLLKQNALFWDLFDAIKQHPGTKRVTALQTQVWTNHEYGITLIKPPENELRPDITAIIESRNLFAYTAGFRDQAKPVTFDEGEIENLQTLHHQLCNTHAAANIPEPQMTH